MSNEVVYYCYESDQPYVCLSCIPYQGFVWCEGHNHGQDIHCCEVQMFSEESGRNIDEDIHVLYTFDASKVTCEQCFEKMKEKK